MLRGVTNNCPSCGSVSVSEEEDEFFLRPEGTVLINRRE